MTASPEATQEAIRLITPIVEEMVPVVGAERVREIFNLSLVRVRSCSEHVDDHPMSEYLDAYAGVVKDAGNDLEIASLGIALMRLIVDTMFDAAP